MCSEQVVELLTEIRDLLAASAPTPAPPTDPRRTEVTGD